MVGWRGCVNGGGVAFGRGRLSDACDVWELYVAYALDEPTVSKLGLMSSFQCLALSCTHHAPKLITRAQLHLRTAYFGFLKKNSQTLHVQLRCVNLIHIYHLYTIPMCVQSYP